jgi:hypothetical protein
MTLIGVLAPPPNGAGYGPTMGSVGSGTEIREFLTTRRARVTPERAGLRAHGGRRRVQGLLLVGARGFEPLTSSVSRKARTML